MDLQGLMQLKSNVAVNTSLSKEQPLSAFNLKLWKLNTIYGELSSILSPFRSKNPKSTFP